MCKKVFFLLCFLPVYLLSAQTIELKKNPKGSTPKEVGKRLAYNFVNARHELYAGRYIHYAEVCTWNGALDYALKTKDEKLVKHLQDKFEPFFTREKALLPPMNHVDYNMFGSLALKLYQITNDKRYLKMGLEYADTQWEVPENAKPEEKPGLKKDIPGRHACGIDDMYMITVIQNEAYKVTVTQSTLIVLQRKWCLYLDDFATSQRTILSCTRCPLLLGSW